MTEQSALAAVLTARAEHGPCSWTYRSAVRALNARYRDGRWCLTCMTKLPVDSFPPSGWKAPVNQCRACHTQAMLERGLEPPPMTPSPARLVGLRPVDLVPCSRCGLRGHEAEACDLPLRFDPWNRRPNVNFLYVVTT